MREFFWWMTQILTAVGLIFILAIIVVGFVLLIGLIADKIRLRLDPPLPIATHLHSVLDEIKEIRREFENGPRNGTALCNAQLSHNLDNDRSRWNGHDRGVDRKGRIFLGIPAAGGMAEEK